MEKTQKIRTGKVVSDRMDKTVVVLVKTLRRHPAYKKVVRQSARFKVHDEKNTCKVGDTVKIVETRPLSKDKRWRVVEILRSKEVIDMGPIQEEELKSGEQGQ